MNNDVIVIDYGIGNLHSVVKALGHVGGNVTVTSDPNMVAAGERVVLPGVGAFGDAVRKLRERALADAVLRFVDTGRPFLGICVGMQLLLAESEEFGCHRGLGIIDGTVKPISPRAGAKVPQIGWNRISPPPASDWNGTLLSEVTPGSMVYFVHSFTADPARESDRLADAWYGGARLSAAVHRDNVTGFQFHPEKSGPLGLSILARFLR